MNGYTASIFKVEDEATKLYEAAKCQDPVNGNLNSHRDKTFLREIYCDILK